MKKLLPLVAAATAISIAACATSPTGRKQLLLVPEGQMSAMGAQAFDQMKAQTPTTSDPALNSYVQCVSKPLIEAGKDQLEVKDWEIVVFKDDSANAFALPGGKIGVHTGLLPVAKTDAQLAAVIGHEIGHVMARHGGERVSQALAAQGGLTAANAVVGGSSPGGQALMAALGLGAQVGVLLPFGRAQESESDMIGLDLMARAGFDPRESVALWQNMKAASGGKAPPEFLSTHPSSDKRIEDLQANMSGATAKYQQAQAAGRVPKCVRP